MSAYYNEIDPFAAAWLRELIKAGHIAPGEVDERSIADVIPSDVAGFTQCHFFAGIGVWSYALRCAGWPDDRPVWTGSCPCQPFSSAGKGKGFADERHLWPDFHRLISQCRPTVCLGEQVASKDGLAWLDLVQADMENAGYAFGAVDTCAAGVGAPHIRQRLYWVGSDTLGNAALRGCIRGEVGNEAGPQCTALGSRKNERCGRHDTSNDGACLRLANSISGRQPWSRGCSSTQKQRIAECCVPDRLDNSDSLRCEQTASAGLCSNPECYSESCCHIGGLDDAECIGRGARGNDDREHDGQQLDAARHTGRPGPTNGFWRDADWLLCKDGKWRATQSLAIEMADGLAHRLGYSRFGALFSLNPLKETEKEDMRVGRLRGYGNAIVAPQAAAFIESFMEIIKEHQPCPN